MEKNSKIDFVMITRIQNFYHWSKSIFHYNGLLGGSWQLFRRVLRPFGNLLLVSFFEKDLTQPLDAVKSKTNLSITLAEESDFKPLIKLVEERHTEGRAIEKNQIRNLILERFNKGSQCFLVKIENKIIHYNWVSYYWEESLGGRFIVLKKNEAFCLDAYTQEKWRGQGIYPAAHYQMLHFLQKKGYRKAYTLVDLDNRSSRKTHFLYGWRTIGTVLCFTKRGSPMGWLWPITGNIAGFLEKQVPDTKDP